jgi:hypothetical protein
MKHIVLITLVVGVAISSVACDTISIGRTKTYNSNLTEEAVVKSVIEDFGRRPQLVSLQSPNASQAMIEAYSEFLGPDLLETWANEPTRAPGRIVSSPWPDRIEISTLLKAGPDVYEITGFVIEVTSLEVDKGSAAHKIPVKMVVQKVQGQWLITDYRVGG